MRKLVEKRELSYRLLLKLKEELDEVIAAEKPEELAEEIADLIEVLYAYGKVNNVDRNDIQKARVNKNKKRGNFSEGYFLVSIEEALTEEEIKNREETKKMQDYLRTAKHTSTTVKIEMP